MALHGDVKVNGNRVGQWRAVRRPEADDPEGVFTYQCTLSLVYQDGGVGFWEFKVRHPYAEGAGALAARVLARGTGLAVAL